MEEGIEVDPLRPRGAERPCVAREDGDTHLIRGAEDLDVVGAESGPLPASSATRNS